MEAVHPNIDVRISRQDGKWSWALFVDDQTFAVAEATSLVDAAEIAAVIVADKIDCPAAWLASED